MKNVKIIKCHVAPTATTTKMITKKELNKENMAQAVEHVVKVIEDYNPTMIDGHIAFAGCLRGWTLNTAMGDADHFPTDTEEMMMDRLVHLVNSMNQFDIAFWKKAAMSIDKNTHVSACGMTEPRVFNALRKIYAFCPGLIDDPTRAFDSPEEFTKFFWATIENYKKAYGNMHTPAYEAVSWCVNLG